MAKADPAHGVAWAVRVSASRADVGYFFQQASLPLGRHAVDSFLELPFGRGGAGRAVLGDLAHRWSRGGRREGGRLVEGFAAEGRKLRAQCGRFLLVRRHRGIQADCHSAATLDATTAFSDSEIQLSIEGRVSPRRSSRLRMRAVVSFSLVRRLEFSSSRAARRSARSRAASSRRSRAAVSCRTRSSSSWNTAWAPA